MIDRINGRLALMLATVALLVLLLTGWFMLVSPQRSKAAALDGQIEDSSVKLASTQAFMRSPAAHQSVVDLHRLQIALPDDVRMSDILRQLAWASRVSRVSLDSITPSAVVPSNGAQAVPIALSVTGHYFRIAKFMHLLRAQVVVKDGRVHASGRLYAIDNVSFASGDKGLITASLALDAFVHGSAPTAAPASTTPGDTSTSTTTTPGP